MEWILVLSFCGLVAAGAFVFSRKSVLLATLWTAVWGIAFAVLCWPF